MSIRFVLSDGTHIDYTVGEKKPEGDTTFATSNGRSKHTVVKVLAIGEELGIILSYFNNLPSVRSIRDYTTWTGDFAAFIYDNFPYHFYSKE